ncbi:MAG: hypothetical protein JSW17_01175 [Candidatus Omnitrophota bacterium]|nr:MAG: hypothetical protein JSW17_01175 [Candidatus Omnitrophota bacterium]
MIKLILKELKHHAPFTALGAISGIVLMVFLKNIPANASYNTFYVLHPMHVLLSALVTASMYSRYKCKHPTARCKVLGLLFVGYVGSIGIATLSDSLIPYAGEALLGMAHRHAHIGFIEKWWLINPLAIIGIAIAYFRPTTKVPHYGHVFLSTWASLFHILMAIGQSVTLFSYIMIFIFLFISVWLPCCVSDIVFPLLFVKEEHSH